MSSLAEAPVAASRVFAETRGRGWTATALLHGVIIVALVLLARRPPSERLRRALSVVAFEAPPPRSRAAEPPPPPPLPPVAPPVPRVRHVAPRVAAPSPPPPAAAPPPVMTAAPSAHAPSHDSVTSGSNTNYHGGNAARDGVGNRGGAAEAPAEAPRPAPEPERPRGPIQLPEEAVAAVASPDNVAPDYPEEARTQGIEATVIARVTITDEGAVTEVSILRGHPLFDSVVREALRRWRYTPATVDGRAVTHFRVVRVPFRLDNL